MQTSDGLSHSLLALMENQLLSLELLVTQATQPSAACYSESESMHNYRWFRLSCSCMHHHM